MFMHRSGDQGMSIGDVAASFLGLRFREADPLCHLRKHSEKGFSGALPNEEFYREEVC